MAGDSGQHVAQIGEGFHVMALAGGEEAEEDGRGAAAVVAATEASVTGRWYPLWKARGTPAIPWCRSAEGRGHTGRYLCQVRWP